MNTISIPEGDKGFGIVFTIYTDSTKTVVKNLTGYTIKIKGWVAGVTTLVIDTACASSVPASGQCTWTVSATDTATIGFYNAEIEMTKTGVIESTSMFQISITESG